VAGTIATCAVENGGEGGERWWRTSALAAASAVPAYAGALRASAHGACVPLPRVAWADAGNMACYADWALTAVTYSPLRNAVPLTCLYAGLNMLRAEGVGP